MSIKNQLTILVVFVCANAAIAQKLIITPTLGVKFSQSHFISNTCPQPTFFTNFQPYENFGVEVSHRIKPRLQVYFKYRTIPIPLSHAGYIGNKIKGSWAQRIFGSNNSTVGIPCRTGGLGLFWTVGERRHHLHRFYGDVNLAFIPASDTLGGIQTWFPDGPIYNTHEKEYYVKRLSPYLSIGYRHGFLNKKRKEIFSLDVNYHFGFSYIAKDKMTYYITDPQCPGQQSVIIASKINSLTFSLTKDIRILK